jgi:hypothetical protein
MCISDNPIPKYISFVLRHWGSHPQRFAYHWMASALGHLFFRTGNTPRFLHALLASTNNATNNISFMGEFCCLYRFSTARETGPLFRFRCYPFCLFIKECDITKTPISKNSDPLIGGKMTFSWKQYFIFIMVSLILPCSSLHRFPQQSGGSPID